MSIVVAKAANATGVVARLEVPPVLNGMRRSVRASAASDLWQQIFARLAANPATAVVDPQNDEQADRDRGHEAMRAAGWTEDWITASDIAHKERIAAAPETSPGINPGVEAHYAILADAIEAAMARLKYQSQEKVARGVEPRVGPYAAKTNVIMTNESIVTVGAFLFRYCGLVARAFTRTFRLDPWLWEPDKYDEGRARELIAGDPQLLLYWMHIYTSFAISGTHALVPYRPSTLEELMLMEQVARAMEIFAIAHEYGHHHLDHGRKLEADPRAEEFAADAFALRVSDEVEKQPVVMENPYLLSGAGALILLSSLDTLRAVENALGARDADPGTHPSVTERIARFESIRLLFPDEYRWLKGFRTASHRVMMIVQKMLMEGLASMSDETREVFRHHRAEFEQWKDLKD
jgi:hypothetical protein